MTNCKRNNIEQNFAHKKVIQYDTHMKFHLLAMGHEAVSMSHRIVGEPDDYNTQCFCHHHHHLTQGVRQLELSPTNSPVPLMPLPRRGTRILKTGSNAGESVYGVHGWIALYSIF